VCERKGRSAILIATAGFATAARTEARVLGMPDARIITIPHPLAGISASSIGEHAQQIVRELLGLVAATRS
jgi:hypothetical protein